jgi:hypothetical protein
VVLLDGIKVSPERRRANIDASLLAPVRSTFRAVVVTVIPEAAVLDESGWRDVEQVVEGALRSRPKKLRRQLGLLLRIITVVPVVRYGRRFAHLDPERRSRVLARFQDSPLFLLRRGFWGLRTLALMGYYARPAAAREIGYRATPAGWEAKR